MTDAGSDACRWARSLFRRSVVKQAKWNALRRAIGDASGQRCVDLGSDNGVVSLLLRDLGGEWRSGDIDADAVECIRHVLGEPADLLAGPELPYPAASKDMVVVVDLLEHLEDDHKLVAELARVVAPGGRVVVNVPYHRPRSMLRRLRLRLGLTDEKHGHVRPGYTKSTLRGLLEPHFSNVECRSYQGPCTELIDILITWAMERRGAGRRQGESKGGIVTPWGGGGAGDVASSRLYRCVYPPLKAFSLLDYLFLPLPGFRLIATATRPHVGVPAPSSNTRQ